MIPDFNHSHVLPPFIGDKLSQGSGSPYVVSALELTERFAISPPRRTILLGFFAYRARLRGFGFSAGFQWLDGSFVEDIEAHQQRSPNDIDLVTFAHGPDGLSATETSAILQANLDVFDRDRCKATFHCDAFLVRLKRPPEKLVQDVRYWYGLFSHRKSDQLWKGLLQLPLESDDELALAMLDNATSTGEQDAGTA
jgi:hypothetical protein